MFGPCKFKKQNDYTCQYHYLINIKISLVSYVSFFFLNQHGNISNVWPCVHLVDWTSRQCYRLLLAKSCSRNRKLSLALDLIINNAISYTNCIWPYMVQMSSINSIRVLHIFYCNACRRIEQYIYNSYSEWQYKPVFLVHPINIKKESKIKRECLCFF